MNPETRTGIELTTPAKSPKFMFMTTQPGGLQVEVLIPPPEGWHWRNDPGGRVWLEQDEGHLDAIERRVVESRAVQIVRLADAIKETTELLEARDNPFEFPHTLDRIKGLATSIRNTASEIGGGIE